MVATNFQYNGSFNHEMINRICIEHENELTDNDKTLFNNLRIGIHRINEGGKSLNASIYLENNSTVTITNQGAEKELVIQFDKKKGDIDYQWVEKEKTFIQITLKFCSNVAAESLNEIADSIKDLIGKSFPQAVEWLMRKGFPQAVAWLSSKAAIAMQYIGLSRT